MSSYLINLGLHYESRGFRIRKIMMIKCSNFTASDYNVSSTSFGKPDIWVALRNWLRSAKC